MPEDPVPFSLMCGCYCGCDAGGEIESREQAEQEGWTEIEYDDGHSWNYLGICPDCKVTCN